MRRTAPRFALLAAFGLACIVAVSGCASAADAPPADAPVGAAGADIYVSPGGDDTGPGTQARPLASVAAAQRAVRELRAAQPGRKRPVVVMLRGGFYPLKDTLRFAPEDSGTENSPTIYRAAPNETPVISGGRVVKGWKVNANGWWEVTLPETKAHKEEPYQGLGKSKWEFSQLFVNGTRRYRPRQPAKGYFKIGAPAAPSPFAAKYPGEGTDSFAFGRGQIKADWHNLVEVEFILMNGWNTGRYRLDDVKGNVASITGPGAGGVWWNGIIAKRRYFLVNVKDNLGPGHFYLDRQSGVLTYAPLEGETPQKSAVIAPRVRRLLLIKGDMAAKRWVEHIRFEGLTFAHANWNLVRNIPKGGRGIPQAELDVDSAVKATGMRHCTFKACTIKHTGQYGLRIGVACKNNLVEDCELLDLGGGGIWLGSTHEGGWGFADPLPEGAKMSDEFAASHNVIRNCLIAHGGRFHAGSVGFWIGQTHHNLIEHNDIFDFYYSGMNIGWRWGPGESFNHDNIIQFNHIHKIGQGVLQDMGGIYTLGYSRRTVVRNNVINDVSAYRNNQGCGIYTDAGSSFYTFENNLVYRTIDGAYHHHFGKENVIRNNIFAFGYGMIKISKGERHRAFTFERNIVIWNHGPLMKGGTNYNMHHNLWWHTRGKHRRPRNDKDSIVADPGFVNAEKFDFRFKDETNIKKIGFKPFDHTKAGRLKGFRRAADLPPVQRAVY